MRNSMNIMDKFITECLNELLIIPRRYDKQFDKLLRKYNEAFVAYRGALNELQLDDVVSMAKYTKAKADWYNAGSKLISFVAKIRRSH